MKKPSHAIFPLKEVCSAGSSAGILPVAARAQADLQPGEPALRARLPPGREAGAGIQKTNLLIL